MKRVAKLLTTKQFAEEMRVDYRTALNWLNAGLVPKAKKRSSIAGVYWEIPESALQMERPKPGPKTAKKHQRRKAR